MNVGDKMYAVVILRWRGGVREYKDRFVTMDGAIDFANLCLRISHTISSVAVVHAGKVVWNGRTWRPKRHGFFGEELGVMEFDVGPEPRKPFELTIRDFVIRL